METYEAYGGLSRGYFWGAENLGENSVALGFSAWGFGGSGIYNFLDLWFGGAGREGKVLTSDPIIRDQLAREFDAETIEETDWGIYLGRADFADEGVKLLSDFSGITISF
jgi:hypothetical protein